MKRLTAILCLFGPIKWSSMNVSSRPLGLWEIPPFLVLVQAVTIAINIKNLDMIDKPDDLLTSLQALQQQQDVINRILAA
ncbi:MAG: hypothetical protein VCE75_01620 [Alphaproteobacteria bacterium]